MILAIVFRGYISGVRWEGINAYVYSRGEISFVSSNLLLGF